MYLTMLFILSLVFLTENDPGIARVAWSESSRESLASMLKGHNDCFMVQETIANHQLNQLLPPQMSIPDDRIMARYGIHEHLDPDRHPVLMSFCHGEKIGDQWTKLSLPPQEEIMFVIPVLYHDEKKGIKKLCSYIPILYLDSYLGVAGGLIYGLRKEYHPKMRYGVGNHQKDRWWRIDDIVGAFFTVNPEKVLPNLPKFYEQTFQNPFVTISYPLPKQRTIFYQARIFPKLMLEARVEKYFWEDNGWEIKAEENEDGKAAVFTSYEFTMSSPKTAQQFFKNLMNH